jgi:hypothetical protein
MAETEARTRKQGDKKPDDVLVEMRARWDRAKDREEDNIRLAYDDLTFLSGHDYSQWPSEQKQKRIEKDRPVVQINHLPKFVHQITGDIRQMKPSIKVVPVDSGADEKVASKIAGMVRYIENRSDASAVYFRAADSQVACGIGHWQVITEYADNSTFNQEIRISPIEDGVAVLWDPDSSLPSKEDAGYCFVPIDMSRASFTEAYPDAKPDDIGSEWSQSSEWVTDDYVRIAAYWVKKPAKKRLALYTDGRIDDITDGDQSAVAFALMSGARIEERESTKVCRYLVTASEVLEGPVDWPGRFIPIVPVVGEETRVGRKIIRNGIVRHAKDPQRMVNYFHAAHTETVALQPKAPFLVTELNVKKYQEYWERANTENDPFLVYEPDSKNGGAPPQRVQPPVSSQGISDGLLMAVEDLKQVIGIYDAGLGNKSNETSGKAIEARQREGDVGSYLYIDNFARAIRHTGNIIVDLLPYIYDTQRVVRVMGEDGKIDLLEINKLSGKDQAGQDIYENDITVGSYDVVATVGPSYSTRREESKEGMLAFTQANPAVAPLITDLVAKAQDWPMADDIAKRVRATLPPNILQMEELEKQGMDPAEIQKMMAQQNQGPPPDPAVMQAQAKIEQDAQRLQFEQQKAVADGQLEMDRAQAEERRAQEQLQIEREKIASQERMAQQELAAKIMLEREKIQSQERVSMHSARLNAETKVNETATKAETAKYATDNKPKPGKPSH